MQKGQTLVILLIGILIIAVAGGAYYLGRQTTPNSAPNPVITSQTPQSPSMATKSSAISPVATSPIPQSTPQPLPCGNAPSDIQPPTHLPLPATPATLRGGLLVVDQLYINLSRLAHYVIYANVRSDLGQTREETTDRLGKMVLYYNQYLIGVNDSVIGLGGTLDLPGLPATITIRDQSTTTAPTYSVGQSFVGFITVDPQHGTYRSVYQPLPVSECNGEAYLSGTNIRVADFMLSLKKAS